MQYVLIGLGGIIGALSRALIFQVFIGQNQAQWATALVNILGSFVIGGLFAMGGRLGWGSSSFYFLVIVGFMGSFTTFSAFSLDILKNFQNGDFLSACAHISINLFGCLIAVMIGYKSFQWLHLA